MYDSNHLLNPLVVDYTSVLYSFIFYTGSDGGAVLQQLHKRPYMGPKKTLV